MVSCRSLLAATAAVLCCLLAVASGSNPCTWSYSDGVSFDLQPLESTAGYYVLDRYAGHNIHNYTYVFNVCANTNHIPRSGPGRDGSACDTTIGSGGETLTGPGPAFQVARWFDGCYRLGDSWDDVEWGLLDAENPAYGVTLRYIHGESCSNGKRRSLELSFICADDTENIPNDAEEPVEETEMCYYEVFLYSAYGCPKQCPIVDGKLCAGHGVCGYDTDAKAAGCFCNTGWGGESCTETVSAPGGITGEGVALVIACILLAVILTAVGYMYFKLRRLQMRPDAYKTMETEFNELGNFTG